MATHASKGFWKTVYSDAGIVPEPGCLALLATGGLPLLGFLRRRRLSA